MFGFELGCEVLSCPTKFRAVCVDGENVAVDVDGEGSPRIRRFPNADPAVLAVVGREEKGVAAWAHHRHGQGFDQPGRSAWLFVGRD